MQRVYQVLVNVRNIRQRKFVIAEMCSLCYTYVCICTMYIQYAIPIRYMCMLHVHLCYTYTSMHQL